MRQSKAAQTASLRGLRRRSGSHFAPRKRVWHLPPDGFRELRRDCLLSRKTCADLLGCSPSAVRAWDRGTHRVPWSAVKLLRLFRSGDLGALRPEWHGWTLNRNGIVSPSGIAYSRGDLGWWSLTCRQAECWRQDRQRQRATGGSVTEPPAEPLRSAARLASPEGLSPLPSTRRTLLQASKGATTCPEGEKAFSAGARERQRAAPGAGLVSSQKQVTQKREKVRQKAASSGSNLP